MPKCKECKHWKPDAFIGYIGECERKGGATHEGEVTCDIFEIKTDADFMWCRDCRTTIHKSEKKRHRGHDLHVSVHTDRDAHEYLKAGD